MRDRLGGIACCVRKSLSRKIWRSRAHACWSIRVCRSAQSQACVSAHGLVSQESRQVTFARGRKLIEKIASQLRIGQNCIDTAYNFFKMCVTRKLTRGRSRSHVVAACLYMSCRLENSAHLLLDFGDVTQVNVFDLGRTLNFLSRSLRINLPPTDPCLYVMRFACLLELGEKQKEVVNLATRLVQRMKRDWMATGRRPTSLCGAALLLAARSFNFNRSISDVVKVVHISGSVVGKRLEEFSQTASSDLTIEEFSTVDLEHCEDPPSFRESRREAREEQLAKEAEAAAQMEKDVIPIEEELEQALKKKRREKFKTTSYAKIIAGVIGEPELGVAEEAVVQSEIMDSIYRVANSDEEGSLTTDYSQYAPSLHSLGIKQQSVSLIASLNTPPLPTQDSPDGSLDLTGIDDEEIDTYILMESESAMKERIWMRLYGEYLKEMELRRRKREEDKHKEKDDQPKRKRKRVVSSTQNGVSGSAVEAMERIIHEKRLSHKVNYEILKEITNTASGLEPLRQEENNSQVIANANDLAATLAMGNVAVSEEGNIAIGEPLTPANMSRKEREIIRQNKPLKDGAALRVALGLEPTTSVDSSDSIPPNVKKNIPLSRSLLSTRARNVKPNLSRVALLGHDTSTSQSHSLPVMRNEMNDHSTNNEKASEVKLHATDMKTISTSIIDGSNKEVSSSSKRHPDVTSTTDLEKACMSSTTNDEYTVLNNHKSSSSTPKSSKK